MATDVVVEAPARKRQPRNSMRAMLRGFAGRCPSCGQGAMFARYLKVSDTCPHCGEELGHHQADDAPAYFTIFIVGHIIVAGVLYLERAAAPSPWVHTAIWLPATLLMSLILLPRVKGALVGLQWAFYMHGFGEAAKPERAPAANLKHSA